MKTEKSIHILGLNDSNSAASIIKDGQLISMVREERFDRIKFSDSYPVRAVDYCLEKAGITLKEVDHVVFAWNPGHEIEPQYSTAAVRNHQDFLHYIPNNLLRHITGDKKNKKIISISQDILFEEGNINLHFLPHHHCHGASSFFVSPYERSAILTIDAYGDDITSQFFMGEHNRLSAIGHTPYPQSLGQIYAAVTQYLGYRANADEWKVMGLSSYGEPEYYDFFAEIMDFDAASGELKFDLDYFMFYVWHPRRYSDKFIQRLGPERMQNEELTSKHMSIAASFQKRVEDIVLSMCTYLYEKTKVRNLCLAGGVCMNSKMNGRILKETPFEDVWVPPSADDAGTSMGACFYYWHQVLGHPRDFVMTHDYWGPEYSSEKLRKTLENADVAYTCIDNPWATAAESISAGKVVAWFQGGMEAGQRALGNRSILADPRDPDMKDKVNRLVKHREWYRPFAPSVLKEAQKDYFECSYSSPFMQMVYRIHEDVREKIPAVTHIDGTGRLQTVSKETNPLFYRLIKSFYDLTGIGMVLNTSFNDNNEPIVCTPEEALKTFFSTGLHELYLGNYLVKKR